MLGIRSREERAIQATTWGTWPGDDYAPTWAGVNVDSKSSLQLITVYGCVQFIVNGIATLPLDVYRKGPDGQREGMPIPSWLVTPTVGMYRTAWMSQVLTSLLLDGNAYIKVARSQTGIVELVVLESASVQIRRESGSPTIYVNGVRPNYEVIHIPAIILAGSDVGLSPVEAARQSVGVGIAAQEYGARFFGQGATMSGVIETPGELSPDKAKEMASAWARRHSGAKKAHLPGVLEGGATWKPTGVTNEQAQFLQTQGYTAATIASQMFLIDPSEFGLQAGQGGSITYANLEQRNARKVQVTFLPWIVRIEEALSALLPQPRYVKFNVDGLQRGDTKTQAESFAIATGNKPWMHPSEVRTILDMKPIPGIDDAPASPPPPAGGQPNA